MRTGIIHIVKISMLPKAIYKFSTKLIKIPLMVFIKLEEGIQKYTWECSRL